VKNDNTGKFMSTLTGFGGIKTQKFEDENDDAETDRVHTSQQEIRYDNKPTPDDEEFEFMSESSDDEWDAKKRKNAFSKPLIMSKNEYARTEGKSVIESGKKDLSAFGDTMTKFNQVTPIKMEGCEPNSPTH
jgi:hypothetical protein